MKILIIMITIFIFNAEYVIGGKLDDLEKKLSNKMSILEKKLDEKSKKLDEHFANTLKDKWFNVKFKKGKHFFLKPKPKIIPKAPKPKNIKNDKTPIIEPVLTQKFKSESEKESTEKYTTLTPTKEEYNVHFNFLGKPVTIIISKKIKTMHINEINKNSIADYWHKVSLYPYKTTLTQIHKYYKNLLGSDWAFLMLLEIIAKKIYPGDRNIQNLYVWFLLNKSGYQARVAYDSRNIYILIPTTTPVYGRTFFTFNDEKFYKLTTRGIDRKMGAVYTYKENYPGANMKLNLKIMRWPRIKKIEKIKNLSFGYSGKKYSIPVHYEAEIIKFVKNYPITTIDSYAEAPLSDFSRKSLLIELSKLIKGKTETEAVNLILAFVQKSFSYKTDQQQFGYEKWFFAEETIYYPYSDCEDRAVMFARLVNDLIGIPIIMLHYPGHMATAVLFSNPVSGDKVIYQGKAYTVCDPTYIGATYGMEMPQFKNISPKVIKF